MPYSQGLQRLQGDPGFFGFVGKVLGTVAKAIPGPIGAIAGAVLGPRKAPSVATPGFVGPTMQPRSTALVATGPGRGTAVVSQACAPGAGCPRGMHLNKSAYFLRDGTFVAEGTRCVPNRRRNPLNPRALRKANSRQRGFLRAVDATLKTMPTKAGVSRRRRDTRK